ncbi:MAG: hypothetical protein IJQ09_06235, partial [Prevotella sp.]|nr:hypothetical protein [Prevotella sp.]
MLQDYIDLRFDGCVFVLAGVTFFVAGTIFSDTFYQPEATSVQIQFKEQWVTPLLLFMLVAAMVTPLYSIVLHGFSLRALLDMRE